MNSRVKFVIPFFGLMLLNLACLGIFITKLLYLKRFDLPLNNVEFVYLGLIMVTLLKDVTLVCAIFRVSLNVLRPRHQITTQSLLLIVWIIISALYTKFELGPLTCSTNFINETPEYATACTLRKINFIMMWIYAGALCISVLNVMCFKSKDYEDDQDEPNLSNNLNNSNNSNNYDEKFKPQFHS